MPLAALKPQASPVDVPSRSDMPNGGGARPL
jgi:hypothetical protein